MNEEQIVEWWRKWYLQETKLEMPEIAKIIMLKQLIALKQGQTLPIHNIGNVSGSFSDLDLLNGYCAGALETLTNKEATFLGYDHLIKIKTEAEEWKERYSNDR